MVARSSVACLLPRAYNTNTLAHTIVLANKQDHDLTGKFTARRKKGKIVITMRIKKEKKKNKYKKIALLTYI